MSMVINTNTASLVAQAAQANVNKAMDSAMERLSTGMRINSAADDAAGLAISTRMEAEIKGLQQAVRNAGDAQALINTAEGATDEVTNMLQRMRELAVQAANDTNSDSDRASLQLEIDQLLTEIDRVSTTTQWAGKNLLGAGANKEASFDFQIGSAISEGQQIKVGIKDISSKSLGVGATGSASGGRVTGHASAVYENGKLTVMGEPKQGDAFTFTLNGESVSATFSTTDQYSDDAAGAAAQIKAAIDAVVAGAPTKFSGLSVVDNRDGSLSISQDSKVKIDTFAVSAGSITATISEKNGTLTFGGTAAVADAYSVKINGTTVTIPARSATDGYGATTAAGNAAYLAAKIKTTAGLENVNVTDHGDGSLTITQSEQPFIEGLEVSLTTQEPMYVSYDDISKISVSGTYTEGQTISFDLFGETISFKTSSEDGYDNTLAGVASQMASAINDAGIPGVTAAKTSGANSVTLTAQVVSGNAVVDSGTQFIATTIGSNATSKIALSGADKLIGAVTAATYTNGDAYTFEVDGHEIKLVIDTSDGYADTKEGVGQQMKDLIDDLGLEGLTVALDVGTTAGVSITRALTGTANSGSTVVTNVSSLAEDEIGSATFSGSISVNSSAAAADAIARIDEAMLKINDQRSTLGAISNRLDHTINNLTNIVVNTEASQSRIQDADFAAETSNLTKAQILSQAATAMLAQANASKQSVLSLLQG